MKRFLTLFSLIVITLSVTAQSAVKTKTKKERKVELSGEVYDSFTKAKVKAHLTLMTAPDSAVVDTMTCWTYGSWSGYRFNVPARQADFIIRATAEGYEDTYMNYELRHIARNSFFELPRLLMKKKQRSDDDIYKEVGMEGVVVTGTKVKLAYRGDTLVYNASAFNLPEGSMLDGLIRQMPGAELKDNGDIYINGRKVDYLTLNGKDFFKGQNKVMLDNLPYYTVKELKVYDKSTKRSELIGQDIEKKDYVMDVQLKREYNRGYMANAQAGGGTDDRYMARLFGLYYDDHSRASLFGNLNNINETRQPGGQGDWTPSNMPQGQRTTRQTGLHFETEDQDKRWENNFNATLSWDHANDETRRATETFATSGNIFAGSESWARQKDFRLNASNQFVLRKPFTLWGQISVGYTNGHRNTYRQDSTWQSDIANRNAKSTFNRYGTLSLSGLAGFYKKFDWGDIISVDFAITYNRNKPSEQFSLSRTYYAEDDSTELRHYYTDNHSEDYQYHLEGSYHLQLLGKWFISPFAGYWQTMRKGDNMNYRLDWLYSPPPYFTPIGASVPGDYPTGGVDTEWLPSTREALMSVIDPFNCDTQMHMRHGYSGGLEISHSTDKEYFEIRLPINNNDDRMHYDDGVLDTIARRNFTHFTPRIQYYRWGVKRGLQRATYSVDMTEPDFADLMPVDDTTNPLAWQINNPDLKTRITHNVGLSFVMNNDSTRHFGRLWTNGRLTQRAWGTRTIYDTESGAYTYMQDNIDGNCYWGMGLSYEMPLDKQKQLTMRQRADAEYNHSVDFDVLYLQDDMVADNENTTSTVNNWTLHYGLALEYQRSKLTATLSGDISWRSATSNRLNFDRISAFDFNYGAAVRYTIPWVKMSLATDLRMYSRRGYSSAMMNTNDLVWNAELARSLLKERLTLKLTAFDLLHQLSSKQYSVNAQGRYETWNNCIPRYLMFSVAYKFAKAPKNK